jgi:tRNA(Ile)-lysidine synthase
MNHLETRVNNFLAEHCDFSKPVLLALSGGPDSLALLYLLKKYQIENSLVFAIAHVNHGWRLESNQEAAQLEKLANELKIPFHSKNLNPKELKGNLEEASRLERLRFFHELCLKHGFQAVLLGHHADDQAETVLKRILEGAGLARLSSLLPVNRVEGVILWRPLLKATKMEIESWLCAQSIRPFYDSTNLDSRFLRGRMRTRIIPELSKEFGKEITSGLCHIASEAQELRNYLNERIKPYLEHIERHAYGVLLDLSKNCPDNQFELKALLHELFSQEGVCLNRELTQTLCELIYSRKADRELIVDGLSIQVDRGRLFIMRRCEEAVFGKHALELGTFQSGPWKVIVKKVESSILDRREGWKAVWNGHIETVLPMNDYQLGKVQMNACYPGQSSISKWWNDHKIPAFLRRQVPVVWLDGKIYHEFLSERPKAMEQGGSFLHVTLCRIIA